MRDTDSPFSLTSELARLAEDGLGAPCRSAFGVRAALQWAVDQPRGRDALRRAAAEAEPWRALGDVGDGDLLQQTVELAALGRIPGFEPPLESYGVFEGGDPPDELEHEAEDLAEKHHIEFVLEDGNGDPYPGVNYVLNGPDDDAEDGTTGDDASVRKDGVLSDGYTLVIKEVAWVGFGVDEAKAGVEVPLRGRATGYPDGAAVEFRIFRQYRENDEEALATVEAELADGAAEAAWTFEPDPEGPLAAAPDVVQLIVELRVVDDGAWAKSETVLPLSLPRLARARWGDAVASPGSEAALVIDAPGVLDGETVTVEILQRWRTGDEVSLETLGGVTVEDGQACATWTVPDDGEEDDNATTEAEIFFIATLDSDAGRVSAAPPLWVSRRGAELASGESE